MPAQVPQPHPLGQSMGHQPAGGPRDQHLAAVAGLGDPGRPVHVQAQVVVPPQDPLPGVQAHPNPQRILHRPGVGGQGPLGRHRRPDRPPRAGEGREHRIALAADLHPTAPVDDRLTEDRRVAVTDRPIAVPQALQQPGRALDVAEPEGDRPRRQPSHGRTGRRRPSGRRLGAGGEPLAHQQGQIVADQPAQLGRGPEVPVGVRALLLDPLQQAGQTGLAVRRRRLDIQQPRQPRGQLEFLLQPRALHARADPPITLPVQPDEDVALGQVGPVQLLGRIGPRPRLEQHRGQPQRRDSPGDRPPLGGQLTRLTHRGTHKHPQPPVRRADTPPARHSLVHQPPLEGPTPPV